MDALEPRGRQKWAELVPTQTLHFADSKMETQRGLVLEPNLCH